MQERIDKTQEAGINSPEYKSSRRKDFPQIEQAFAKHRYMKKKRTASGNIHEIIGRSPNVVVASTQQKQQKQKTEPMQGNQEPSRMVKFQSRSFFDKYDPRCSSDKYKPSFPSNRQLISWIKLELQLVVEEFKLPKHMASGIQNIYTLKPLFEFIREFVRNIAQISMVKPFSAKEQQEAFNYSDRKAQLWSRLKIEQLQTDCHRLTNKLLAAEQQLENNKKQIKNMCLENDSKMNEITILRSQLSMLVSEKPQEVRTAINISELSILRDEVARLKEELIGKNEVIAHLENIAKQKDEQFDRLRSDKLRLVQMYSSLEREKLENAHTYEQQLLRTIKKLCVDKRDPQSSFVNETVYREVPDSRREILHYLYHSMQTLQNREDEYRRERKEIAKSREKLLRDTIRGLDTQNTRRELSFSGYHQGSSISHFVGSFTPTLKVAQNDFR